MDAYKYEANLEMESKNIHETIINGNRIYIEDGEVKTEFSEMVQKSGYTSLEEARQLLHAFVNMLEECYGQPLRGH